MSAFSAFYDLLLPELPGCSTALVDLNLREVAREFCKSTSAWRMPLTAIDLVADQATYTLVPTVADAAVVKLVDLTVNSELLWADTDRESLNASEAAPKYVRNEPPFTLSGDLSQIVLITDDIPTESLTAGMVITAALQPDTDAATLPDFLRTEHSEAIRYGVLSRLMVMGKKPWGDRPLATVYEGRWNAALNHAAYQAQVGNTSERLRTKKWG